MKKTCIKLFIIVTDEIIIGVSSHVRGRYFDISIAGNVDTCRIIVFVILAGCDRESRDCSFSVIHDCVYIRWKYGIGIFVNRNSRICPPEKCLRSIRAIVKLSFDLDVRFIRIKCKGCHAFRSVHFVDLTYIYGG